jgi:midasin
MLQQEEIIALEGMGISALFSIVPCFSLHLCSLHLSVIVLSVSPFVLTATLRKSYEVALMAVDQKWPVLLYGPVGAGKTALINKLAQIVGNRGIL